MHHFPSFDSEKSIRITDGDKGQMAAFFAVFSFLVLFLCSKHLADNVQKNCNRKCKHHFWRLSKAYSLPAFQQDFALADEKLLKYLDSQGKTPKTKDELYPGCSKRIQYFRVKCPGLNYYTTSLSESRNNQVNRPVRQKDFVTAVFNLVDLHHRKHIQKQNDAHSCTGVVPPKIEGLIRTAEVEMAGIQVKPPSVRSPTPSCCTQSCII